MELARRLAALLGTWGGVYLLCVGPPALVRVRAVDVGSDVPASDRLLAGRARRMEADPARGVRGPAWERLAAAVTAEAPAVRWPDDLEWRRGSGAEAWYRPDEEPVAEIVEAAARNARPTTVRVAPSGSHLRVSVRTAGEFDGAPAGLARPMRHLAAWVFAVGWLVYAAYPWPRRKSDAAFYARGPACVLPDVAFTLASGALASVPLLVASGSVDRALGEFAWLTAACWTLAASGIVTAVVSADRSAFSIDVSPDGLLLTRWTGSQRVPFSDICAVVDASWHPPRWLRTAAWAAGLLTFARMGGMRAAMVARSEGPAIGLVLRSGQTLRVWTEWLRGGARLLRSLEQQGIEVRPAAWERVRDED